MYKFNNNDITTGYIKELLHSFNLPQHHVLTPDTTVFPNNDYIYKNKIYKFLGAVPTKLSGNLSSLPSTMKEIGKYFYGQKILNTTKTLNVSSPLYDTYTHEYLGEYLRFHRDYVGVNLMSMYNCFSNNMPRLNININFPEKSISFNSFSNDYKIYSIPVRFFQNYTIGIDCDTQVEMFCGFYDNGVVNVDENDFYSKTYTKKIGTRFKKPFIFSKLNELDISSTQYLNEKNLVLFIKIPFSCESSITVLEGDYLSNCEHYFEEGIERLSNVPLLYREIDIDENIDRDATNYTYINRLQLFNINSEVSYPFADRLTEYLFKNVVDSTDEIGENIKRVQNILLKKGILKTISKYGEWSNSIRQALYAEDISLNLIHKTFDLLGYYDKDLEEALGD